MLTKSLEENRIKLSEEELIRDLDVIIDRLEVDPSLVFEHTNAKGDRFVLISKSRYDLLSKAHQSWKPRRRTKAKEVKP